MLFRSIVSKTLSSAYQNSDLNSIADDTRNLIRESDKEVLGIPLKENASTSYENISPLIRSRFHGYYSDQDVHRAFNALQNEVGVVNSRLVNEHLLKWVRDGVVTPLKPMFFK